MHHKNAGICSSSLSASLKILPFGFQQTGRSLFQSHCNLFILMGLPIQMLSMGSSPDGCIKQTQRILETFHVTCQVGITLLADVAKNNLQSHQIESQWRWLYVPKLCVYSRLLGWWCAWERVSWAMGGGGARNRRFRRRKTLRFWSSYHKSFRSRRSSTSTFVVVVGLVCWCPFGG